MSKIFLEDEEYVRRKWFWELCYYKYFISRDPEDTHIRIQVYSGGPEASAVPVPPRKRHVNTLFKTMSCYSVCIRRCSVGWRGSTRYPQPSEGLRKVLLVLWGKKLLYFQRPYRVFWEQKRPGTASPFLRECLQTWPKRPHPEGTGASHLVGQQMVAAPIQGLVVWVHWPPWHTPRYTSACVLSDYGLPREHGLGQ